MRLDELLQPIDGGVSTTLLWEGRQETGGSGAGSWDRGQRFKDVSDVVEGASYVTGSDGGTATWIR